MTESTMQTLFRKHLEKTPPREPEVYELKICRSKSLPFDALKVHQKNALIAVTKGFFHKLIDPPIWTGMEQTRFNKPRPFDCFYLRNINGFVVIWFYKPREKKIFIKIPILKWVELEATAGRKSITEEMANSVGQSMYITNEK